MTTETVPSSDASDSPFITRWTSVLHAQCLQSGIPFSGEKQDPAEPALAFARRAQVPEPSLTNALAEVLEVPLRAGTLEL
jgi:hypothetical protein